MSIQQFYATTMRSNTNLIGGQVIQAEMPHITIEKAFTDYIQCEVLAGGMAPGTLRHWDYTKNLAVNYWGKELDIQELDVEAILNYRNHLASWLRPDTVRKGLTSLRCVIQWCGMRGYSVLNPGFIKLPKHEKRTITFLTEEQIRDFIDLVKLPSENMPEWGRLRNVAMCEVLFSSGVRVSELVKLNKTSIKNGEFVTDGKSKNSRPCYISKRAEEAVAEYMEARPGKSNALFTSTQADKRISVQTVRNLFKRICKTSNFEGVHPHTFRHSFATFMLMNGVDITLIAKYLGHENLQTTQLYTHVTSPQLKETHARIMANI